MFNKEFNKSVRFQFLGVLSLILFGGTVVLSTVIAINEKEALKHSLMTKGRSFASYIAKLSQDPLIMKEYIQLDSLVNEANKDEDIGYVVIQDSQGNLVTSQYASINYARPRLKAALSGLSKDSELPDIIATIKKRDAVLELSVPIRTGADTIGAVTVGMSQHAIRRQTVKTILFVIVLNFIVALVLGAALFVASKKIILTPISELAHAASRLSQGDLSTQVKIKATGEVRVLVDSFNLMAENLEKTTVSREYVDSIIQSMMDSLIVVSPEGTITEVNAAACALLEYDEEELVGQPVNKVIEHDPQKHTSVMEEVLSKGSIGNSERVYLSKSGKMVPVLFSASLLRNIRTDAGLQRIVCVAQDITERKRAEAQLTSYSEDLAEVNEELKNFAYIVSHDLRAPLVNIKGFSGELERALHEIGPFIQKHLSLSDQVEREKVDPVLQKEIPEALTFIGSSVNRMDNLINAVLKLSRAGRRKLAPEPIIVQDLVRTVVDSLTHQIESRKITVTVGELPDLVADRTAVEQVFGNLLDNAIKYLDPGRPGAIAVSAERNGTKTVFHIQDNGRGMAKGDISKAFELFRRVGTQDVPGEGMGLAYVKMIVRLMGGRIWCESEPGQGTTFSFSLPVHTGNSGEQAPRGRRS